MLQLASQAVMLINAPPDTHTVWRAAAEDDVAARARSHTHYRYHAALDLKSHHELHHISGNPTVSNEHCTQACFMWQMQQRSPVALPAQHTKGWKQAPFLFSSEKQWTQCPARLESVQPVRSILHCDETSKNTNSLSYDCSESLYQLILHTALRERAGAPPAKCFKVLLKKHTLWISAYFIKV